MTTIDVFYPLWNYFYFFFWFSVDRFWNVSQSCLHINYFLYCVCVCLNSALNFKIFRLKRFFKNVLTLEFPNNDTIRFVYFRIHFEFGNFSLWFFSLKLFLFFRNYYFLLTDCFLFVSLNYYTSIKTKTSFTSFVILFDFVALLYKLNNWF